MLRRIMICMLAMALITAPLQFVSAETTKVTRCDARLRKSTSTSSDTLATVPGGTDVTVLGSSGGWTKTTYKGHTGYISSDLLMELTRSGYYPLKLGDENQYVRELQKRLRELGYLDENADGVFGETTKTAVILFQKNHKMTQDGIAGGETQRVMFSDSAKAAAGGVVPVAASGAASGSSTANSAAKAASGTTLRLNDRGDDVRSLQQRLIELGFYSGKADGIYGKGTEDAVVAFQKKANLNADGKAGTLTQNLLYASGAPTASGAASATAGASSSSYETYKKGMTNNGIKKMQERLKDLKYMTASATGYFGSQTYAALVTFQQAHNLAADGIAGSATQQLLFSADAKTAGADAAADTGKTYPTLKEGLKSAAVTTMQKELKKLGYLSANATGYFGSQTKTAVIAFQKNNNLTSDGIAGNATLSRLYSTAAIAYGSSASSSTSSGSATSAGKINGPSSSQVKLLHWFQEVKPSLKSSSVVQVYDPVSGYGWKIKALSLGRHFDSEPLTAEDTLYMNAAFGGVTTWTPKAVWVKLPNGVWSLATMHNTPHLSGNIANNNFDGHLCIHFLRDMDECRANDPDYGVQHQKAIRAAWKSLTGQVVE